MSHTEGRLVYTQLNGLAPVIRSSEGEFVAKVPDDFNETDEANARRLVTCWNACHDMPTEDVEELVSLDHGVMRLVVLADDLRKERDELLKALRDVYKCSDVLDNSVCANTEAILSRYPEEE